MYDRSGITYYIDEGWLGAGTGFPAIAHRGTITSVYDQIGTKSDSDGFTALDSNADGVINASDAAYAQLVVWENSNTNGIADAGEVKSLADKGITSLTVAAGPHTSRHGRLSRGAVAGK